MLPRNRSGHSLFHPPKPIDLSQARSGAIDLDLDLEDDEAYIEQRLAQRAGGYSNVPAEDRSRGETFFDAGNELENAEPRKGVFGRGEGQVGYQAGREGLSREDEEQWDRMG